MRTEDQLQGRCVYDYTVAGTTADGAQIQVASGIYTTEDGKDNELILPTRQLELYQHPDRRQPQGRWTATASPLYSRLEAYGKAR